MSAPFDDIDDACLHATGGSDGSPYPIWVNKDFRVGGAAAATAVANRWSSLALYEGNPNAFSVPAVPGAVCSKSTAGAMYFPVAPTGTARYVTGGAMQSTNGGTYMLYDRLWHTRGLAGNTASAQTITGASVTRLAASAQLWAEIHTALGAAQTTLSVSYTNAAGTPGRTATCRIGSTGLNNAQRLLRMSLEVPDEGVLSVQSATLTASTGTEGDFGLVILVTIEDFPCPDAGQALWIDRITGIPAPNVIHEDACLALAMLPMSTSAINLGMGLITTVCR